MASGERRFAVECDGRTVPAIVWGVERERAPLVLAGHGGGGHKADAFVEGLRARLAPRGVAVAAIDAVGHGDRGAGEPGPQAIVEVVGTRPRTR